MSSVLEQPTQIVENNPNLRDKLKQLEETRDGLQVLIADAQQQLDEAKAKQKITGEYADAEWFAKTRAAIREETTELHNTNRQIKTIRAQLSRSNPKAAYFQQAARKVLSPEQYDEINSLANKWIKE
jgi:hypothetical protein